MSMMQYALIYLLGSLFFLWIAEFSIEENPEMVEDRHTRIGIWFAVFAWPLFLLHILRRKLGRR